jgi:hypothetical protein
MNKELLERKFNGLGVGLLFEPLPRSDFERSPLSLDVRKTRGGEEYFELRAREGIEIEVIDHRPRERHLLLLARDVTGKHKFLCGHDERHWFVAAIPESSRGVTGVRSAQEALKPARVRMAQRRLRLSSSERNRRHNEAYIRQGEWFFLPVANFHVESGRIRRDEPLIRSWRGKPHIVEECYRVGGKQVYVHEPTGRVFSEERYQHVMRHDAKARASRFRPMMQDPRVYARGRVRHLDHKTIRLPGWHRVHMNTESRAQAGRWILFLD